MELRASPAPYFILWTLSLVLQSAHSDPQIPCYFAFGESLFDNGNNNDLQTLAKSDYPPYGIDFPDRVPTGRFSNGRNLVDVIAGHLGFEESVPPFASTATMNQETLLKGVNYASGSAGIREETGQILGGRIPLDEQLTNHQTVVSRFSNSLGNESEFYLKRCLYMVSMGTNDYLNNYYLPEYYTTSQHYSPQQYTEALIQQYSQQIQTLYGMGARKVALFGVTELGCDPQAIRMYGPCSPEINNVSSLFNNRLRKLVDELNWKLSDANFTCINMDVISSSSSLGFKHPTQPCCEVTSGGLCGEGSTPCANRNEYVFFDNFHPTDAMNTLTGGRAYAASTQDDAHPVDIRTLIQA